MNLKGQDVLLLLKLSLGHQEERLSDLAASLGSSTSTVHSSVHRAAKARLLWEGYADGAQTWGRYVDRAALLDVLLYATRYVFIVERKGITRGVPTGADTAPLDEFITSSENPYVWAHGEGSVRGQSITPIARNAPFAAMQDPKLHQLLALVDCMRIGAAREREFAEQILRETFDPLRRKRSYDVPKPPVVR